MNLTRVLTMPCLPSGEEADLPSSREGSKQPGAKEVKLTPKAKRKEEKRLRKEQRHREATAAAGGEVEEEVSWSAKGVAVEHDHVITL